MSLRYFRIIADSIKGNIEILGLSAPNENNMQTIISIRNIPYSAQNYKEFFWSFSRDNHNRYKMFENWGVPLKLSWLTDYMQGKPVQDI